MVVLLIRTCKDLQVFTKELMVNFKLLVVVKVSSMIICLFCLPVAKQTKQLSSFTLPLFVSN